MKSDHTTLDGLVLKSTDAAVLWQPAAGDEEFWIPRKVCLDGDGIALVPDRTSAPWFQHAARRASLALFLSPKVKFERPDGSVGKWPGTGTVLFSVGEQGDQALRNGDHLGWLVQA